MIVGRSSFPQNAEKAIFSWRGQAKKEIGHHKNHHSEKPIHALLGRPIRSIGSQIRPSHRLCRIFSVSGERIKELKMQRID